MIQKILSGSVSEYDLSADEEQRCMECFQNLVAAQERVHLYQATSLLINRVDPTITVEEVMELHPELLKELGHLYEDEDRQCVEALQRVTDEAGTSAGATEGKE